MYINLDPKGVPTKKVFLLSAKKRIPKQKLENPKENNFFLVFLAFLCCHFNEDKDKKR